MKLEQNIFSLIFYLFLEEQCEFAWIRTMNGMLRISDGKQMDADMLFRRVVKVYQILYKYETDTKKLNKIFNFMLNHNKKITKNNNIIKLKS